MLSEKKLRLLNKIKLKSIYETKFFEKRYELEWFDELKRRGYFKLNLETQPQQTKDKGFFYIPEWNVLPYLEKVSSQVSQPGNEKYINELLKIIKDITNYHINHNKILDNYRTWWYFVKILCNIPNDKIDNEIIDLMSVWLDSRFDTALVGSEILDRLDIYISTGNAAHSLSDILPIGEGRKELRQIIKDTLMVEYWKEEDGSKRKIMAECLVPDMVPPDLIQGIYVVTHDTKTKLEATMPYSKIPIIPEPHMFFLPSWGTALTQKLFLVEGDMFFSRHQTITISVNTVGVMGKGLASRAKYQFPGMYVYYQDLCRSRKLKMGRPQLYKRESSLDYELADEPHTLPNGNVEKWFLLFPTKRDWKERADIAGIEEGLKWLTNNYKKEGVKSLAIPALGCGLGRLEWSDVGPLLCRYLKNFDIVVAIYLPAEKKISEELLSKDFLLS